MILVDTSVWVDHLRRTNPRLRELLEEGAVLCHPFVVGELACGTLQQRAEVLSLLDALPKVRVAQDAEVLEFIERHRLHGRGLGWVDSHLLASTFLSQCSLWTLDRPLGAQANRLGVSA